MRARQRLSRLLGQGARAARRAAREIGPASRRLAERLAYRPREVAVVALLAGGLCGGLAVERWRARHPEIAARLEAEPPRQVTAVAATPRPRSRNVVVPRCETPLAVPGPGQRRTDAASAAPRLDLNRATPRELARLAGISWGLAARIVAAREAFEGGGLEAPPESFGRARGPRVWPRPPTAPAAAAEPETASPGGAPDPGPLEGSADSPPE